MKHNHWQWKQTREFGEDEERGSLNGLKNIIYEPHETLKGPMVTGRTHAYR